MTVFLELVAVGALILLNAFFVAAEYGLVTVRRTRMIELRNEGNRRARGVLRTTADPGRFIAAMQLGVTLSSLGIGALGEQVLAELFETWLATALAAAIAYIILSYLHVVIGELVPKAIALGHSERTALWVAAPVRAFDTLFGPFVWVLRKSTNFILRVLRQEGPVSDLAVHSEAELRLLVSSATEHGELEQQEQELIYKVFDFADKEVSDVMVPRPEVVAVSVDLPPEQALAVTIDSPYTRYPVYRGSFDDVVGILHVRDLFAAIHDRGLAGLDLETLVRPAHVVPETKDLAALLTEFRRTNQHMAIVSNEYGGMEGIVTLEDLLEEIVGEIEDEFDLPDESVEHVDEDTIRIDGTFPIDDFNERFGAELPDDDYHTVGGFVFGQLGRAPLVGDDIAWDGLHFDVVEVDGNRINRIAVSFAERRRREAEQASSDDSDDELE